MAQRVPHPTALHQAIQLGPLAQVVGHVPVHLCHHHQVLQPRRLRQNGVPVLHLPRQNQAVLMQRCEHAQV